MLSLELYSDICVRLSTMTDLVVSIANQNKVCQRLMTVPGVGPLVALSYFCAVCFPERFKKSENVGAYFGLTPRQFQSGNKDFKSRVSRRGDKRVRQHLGIAATVLLVSSKKWHPLRVWGLKIAKRRGFAAARGAVARKIAIIMHKIWINEKDFQWRAVSQEELEVLKTTS